MNVIADRYQTSLRDKLTMYASLLDFRYKNLCVKTNSEALLPIEVKTKAGDMPLEKVAQVGIMDDEHFLVIPNNQGMMMQVCHAFLMAHPQLKQEVKELDFASEDLDPETKSEIEFNKAMIKDQTGEEMPPVNGLFLTTPEVNDDMKDQLDNAVDGLKKQCEVKFKKEHVDHKSRMALSMGGANPTDIRKANDMLDDMYNNCWKMVEDLTNDTHQDIDEANMRYHRRQEEMLRAQSKDPRDLMSQHDQEAAFSFNPGSAIEE